MPALNAGHTINEALESLASQTFKDFELVLVDDGSTDRTGEIAQTFAERLRVRVIRHESPKGIAKSINAGLAASDSEFVARLDSDDLALPIRLERQLEWMERHAGLGVCGSHMAVFRSGFEPHQLLAHPTKSSEVRTALVQRCAIAHPSVMFRRAAIDRIGNYNNNFDFAEDYELWCRASLLGVQFANIPEALTHYRNHQGQVTMSKAQSVFEWDLRVKNQYLSAWLGGDAIGFAPHFLSLATQFPSREIALAVFKETSHVLMRLAKCLPDNEEFSRVLTLSVLKHLS
jgi:glycosyltransferase involved in cell wall biosynthesis